jgi:hypothetical protein
VGSLKTQSKIITILGLNFLILLCLLGCRNVNGGDEHTNTYSEIEYWAYFPDSDTNSIDVFFVAPTVFIGDSLNWNMRIEDTQIKEKFVGAINMEKGIYDANTNFYAPYYRQVGLYSFVARENNNPEYIDEVVASFEMAYSDVEKAFEYYLSKSDRPFILAGFSQGSEMLIKLMKNMLTTSELQKRLVAAYAIGWRLTQEEVDSYSQLENAKSSNDLGVIISFNSEAEFINTSMMVPEKTLSINPLNWTIDTTYASKDMNLGACFTNYDGNIENEISNLTGAYICPKRGTLKVSDINPDDYLPVLNIFEKGVYHLYDYMFFYRNLEANVQERILAYEGENG